MNRESMRKRFWALLKENKQEKHKEDLVNGMTGGRTTSSNAMTDVEMSATISYLERFGKDKLQKHRKVALSLAHQVNELHDMGWQKINLEGKTIIEMRVFGEWIKERQHFTPFNQMKLKEIHTLIGVLRSMKDFYLQKKKKA